MIDPLDLKDKNNPDELYTNHGRHIGPVREFHVIVNGMAKCHHRGFGLTLNQVVTVELDSYPSPEDMAEEYRNACWDVVICEGGKVAALLIGTPGKLPEVRYMDRRGR